MAVVVVGWAPAARADYIHDNTGVLVYTHGIPSDPLAHQPASDRITAIETYLETEHGIVSEKITHMPYWWNNGLLSLDKNEKEYVIFLYTDMFGPDSTVIHDLTRGYFAGMDGYTCPPFPYNFGEPLNAMPAIIDARVMASPFAGDNIFRPMFEQMQIDIDHMLEQYGHVCWFMGHVHVQAETFSESKIILAEPARPDHPILREIFVKQAAAASSSPENDLLVIVGHGARNDSHNDAQDVEMSCAAEYVEGRLGFADSTALIVREDWEHLSGPAVAAGVEEIRQMLSASGADHVTLIHATGTLEGLSLMTDVLDEAGVSYTIAPNGDILGEEEMVMWAEQTVSETIDYIRDQRPTESTTTPHWDRTYVCEAATPDARELVAEVNLQGDGLLRTFGAVLNCDVPFRLMSVHTTSSYPWTAGLESLGSVKIVDAPNSDTIRGTQVEQGYATLDDTPQRTLGIVTITGMGPYHDDESHVVLQVLVDVPARSTCTLQ